MAPTTEREQMIARLKDLIMGIHDDEIEGILENMLNWIPTKGLKEIEQEIKTEFYTSNQEL
jgi:hypothetical protein